MKHVIAVLFLSLVLASPVAAQEFDVSVNPSEITITKQNLPFQANVSLANNTDRSIRLKPIYFGLDIISQNYDLTLEGNLNSEEQKVSKSIKLYKDSAEITYIDLSAHETNSINMKIDDLPDTNSDIILGLIFIEDTEVLTEGTGSTVHGGVGSLLLIRTKTRNLKDIEVKVSSNKRFYLSSPVEFTLELDNRSDSIQDLTGQVLIYNFLNQNVAMIDISNFMLLPNSTRKLASESLRWNEGFILGPYRAVLTLSQDKDSLTESYFFLALPTKIIVVISVILFFIIGIYLRIYHLRRFRKLRN